MRTVLGMSQEGLGKCVGATEQSVSLWERTGKVPQYADSILRLLVSEKLNGNSKVTDVIERINTVEEFATNASLHGRRGINGRHRPWATLNTMNVLHWLHKSRLRSFGARTSTNPLRRVYFCTSELFLGQRSGTFCILAGDQFPISP